MVCWIGLSRNAKTWYSPAAGVGEKEAGDDFMIRTVMFYTSRLVLRCLCWSLYTAGINNYVIKYSKM